MNAVRQDCKFFDIGKSESTIDFDSLIPQNVVNGNSFDEADDVQERDAGVDALPEYMFNDVLENLLTRKKHMYALMLVCQANLGLRFSDISQFKLNQFIGADGKFREHIYWAEKKTSKKRLCLINDSIKAALIIFMRNVNISIDEPLFWSGYDADSRNAGYVKKHHIDENGKSKAVRINGKYVYETDENGNKIKEKLTLSPYAKTLKKTLADCGYSADLDCKKIRIASHSLRKAYAEKFSDTAYNMKQNGEIKFDSDIQKLVQLDMMHSQEQTTLRYCKEFDRTKEQVCQHINLGLEILKEWI